MKNVLHRVIARISESASIASFGVTVVQCLRFFFTLLFRNNETAFPIHALLKHNGVPFSLTFYSHADLMLFHEVFGGHQYRIHGTQKPEYILDLGANTGISTLYLHTSYPHARISAVEANPALQGRLRETVQGVSTITILPFAVSGIDSTCEFYLNETNPLGSSLINRGQEQKKIRVESRSLTSLVAQTGYPRIDYIKFDIEGAEWDVFRAYPRRSEIRAIIGEVHEDLMNASLDEFTDLWEGMALRLVPTKKPGRSIIYGIRT